MMKRWQISTTVLTALLAMTSVCADDTVDTPMLGITRISDPPPPLDGSLDRLATVPNVVQWGWREDIVFGPARWTGKRDLSGRLFLGWDTNFL